MAASPPGRKGAPPPPHTHTHHPPTHPFVALHVDAQAAQFSHPGGHCPSGVGVGVGEEGTGVGEAGTGAGEAGSGERGSGEAGRGGGLGVVESGGSGAGAGVGAPPSDVFKYPADQETAVPLMTMYASRPGTGSYDSKHVPAGSSVELASAPGLQKSSAWHLSGRGRAGGGGGAGREGSARCAIWA